MGALVAHATNHPDVDILSVSLRDAPIARTRELDVWRNIDLAADGSVVGVELVNMSTGTNLRDVP